MWPEQCQRRWHIEHGNPVDLNDVIDGEASGEMGDDDPGMPRPRSFAAEQINTRVISESVQSVQSGSGPMRDHPISGGQGRNPASLTPGLRMGG